MLNSLTLCFVSFLGGGLVGMGTVLFIQGASTMNFVNGCISAAIAFIVSAVVTYVLGIENKGKK